MIVASYVGIYLSLYASITSSFLFNAFLNFCLHSSKQQTISDFVFLFLFSVNSYFFGLVDVLLSLEKSA